MFKLGPVVSFREASPDGGWWTLSFLVVVDGDQPEPLVAGKGGTKRVEPERLCKVGSLIAWRYLLSVELRPQPSGLAYQIGSLKHELRLPAAGHPPRMAYASCNGFSDPRYMKGIDDKNALWTELARKHRATPYNLLLMGGDQVCADSIWEVVEPLKSWAAMKFKEANRFKASAALKAEVERFYFELYVSRWSQPEVREMLASIPTIMMWDDHDLIDGWGSYPPERQQSDVFQNAIWPAASRAFAVFQQQRLPRETAPAALSSRGFTVGHVIGRTAVLALDMRSERSMERVLSPEHWADVYAWLDRLKNVDHLLLLSSIPVVYPGFDTLERILGWVPGQQELEDDLADHWNSRPHKAERLRLVHRLLRLAEVAAIRPTIMSGDVHVAAVGHIQSSRRESGAGAVVNQLISSAIVHPGPPAAVVFALRHLFDNEDEIDRGITARMVDFPGTQVRFVGKRNFMTIEPDEGRPANYRLWANWWIEGDKHPLTKVIHPLEKKAASPVVAPELPTKAA